MDEEKKTWSNMRGYGNIDLYDYDVNSEEMNISINKYNRIDNLKSPFTTNVKINSAWSGKSIESVINIPNK